jgi:multimeric flavodoxin WrbA
MKVLAINGSPKMEKGNTAMILDPFLQGMRQAGAEVELFYTKKLDINPCQGEFNCWLKTPGKCSQKDDMEMINMKRAESDIIVLASPLYCSSVTGPMKNLLDRLLPGAEPYFEMRENHYRHPLREGVKKAKLALVSNCGLWEMDNFNPMIAQIKAFSKDASMDFAGALLRPHGAALREMVSMGLPLSDIFDAAKEAGRQLIRDGYMSEATLAQVSRELIPCETYVQTANDFFLEELRKLE